MVFLAAIAAAAVSVGQALFVVGHAMDALTGLDFAKAR
jgi:hypothetical protein